MITMIEPYISFLLSFKTSKTFSTIFEGHVLIYDLKSLDWYLEDAQFHIIAPCSKTSFLCFFDNSYRPGSETYEKEGYKRGLD